MADRNRTSLDWDDIRFFGELARQGTLSGVARRLRVNHATVARRLAHLEETLEQPLFERRPDGYVLTAAGERILEDALTMERAAVGLIDQAQSWKGLSGAVRIAATPALAEHFLVPGLGELRRTHPGIAIELIAGPINASLARRQADLALRLARPEGDEALTRKLVVLGYGFYASPDYLERTEPQNWTYIGFDEGQRHLPEALWLASRSPPRHLVFRGSGHAIQRAAAVAGIGVALLPSYLAGPDTGLVRCSAPCALTRELWLVMRPDARTIPAVRTAADAILSLVERHAPLLRGDA